MATKTIEVTTTPREFGRYVRDQMATIEDSYEAMQEENAELKRDNERLRELRSGNRCQCSQSDPRPLGPKPGMSEMCTAKELRQALIEAKKNQFTPVSFDAIPLREQYLKYQHEYRRWVVCERSHADAVGSPMDVCYLLPPSPAILVNRPAMGMIGPLTIGQLIDLPKETPILWSGNGGKSWNIDKREDFSGIGGYLYYQLPEPVNSPHT